MRNLVLGNVPAKFGGREGEPARGRHLPVLDRVAAWVMQGQELVIQVHVGEVEAGHPGDGRQRVAESMAQLLGQRDQLGLHGRAVEAADPRIDRVDRPAADRLEDRVAGFLQAEPSLDQVAVVAGQGDHVRVAEEVGRVQHIDVQGVAGDPLTAVQQPSQRRDGVAGGDIAGVLDRVPGTGLVGHWADAADPRGDVGDLGVLAAAQERLEEPGWLVDLQFGGEYLAVLHDDAQRSLAFDPGQRADSQLPAAVRHRPSSPRAKPGAATLNVDSTRSTARGLMPQVCSWPIRAGRLAPLIGPKQP